MPKFFSSYVGKLARLATSDAFRARLYIKTSSMVPLKKFLDSLPEVPILTLFERIVVAGAKAENTSTPSRYPVTCVQLKVAPRRYQAPVVIVELRPASNTVFPDASDVLNARIE